MSKESCTCHECVQKCHRKPGWFAPGQVEKVAQFLDMSLMDLFRSKLSVDWWEGKPDGRNGPDTLVLSPAVVGGNPGDYFDYNPRGKCVFLVNDRCQIHAVKPWECAEAWCGESGSGLHRQVAEMWDTPEAESFVKELLGE